MFQMNEKYGKSFQQFLEIVQKNSKLFYIKIEECEAFWKLASKIQCFF